MKRRRLHKAIKRIRHHPKGINLLKYLFNKAYHLWLNMAGSTRVAMPSTIMLELSAHCNLFCSICPRDHTYGHNMDMGFMELEKAKQIIDQTWPYLDSIGLTGMGETFLYPYLEELVDYIRSKNKGIVISVSTNAMAPKTMYYAHNLKNKIDTIQVSIDGIGEAYDKIRKGSDFQNFSLNLKNLSQVLKGTKTDLILNMVVTSENYFQMAEMLKFAYRYEIHYVNFTMFNLAAVTGIGSEYYNFFLSEEFLTQKQKLKQAEIKYPGIETTFWEKNPKKGFKNCPFPWTHFYICWNGEIPPCCAKPFPKEMSFGNTFEKPLKQILNQGRYLNFRQFWQTDKTHPFCQRCHFIDLPHNKAKTQF